MATPEEIAYADSLGYITPAGTDMMSDGDDAITENAAVAAKLARQPPYWDHTPIEGSPVDIDTLRTPGKHRFSSTTYARRTVNSPAGDAGQAAVCLVDAGSTGLISQMWVEIYGGGSTGNIWYRTTLSIGSTPFPFGPWKRITPELGQNFAGANAVLMQDYTRRRGPVNTGGKAAIAYRFDHGLLNYRDEIKPLFDARGWKHSQALNPGQWSASENGDVTKADVDMWVQEGLLEIWHHGYSHADTTTENGFLAYIVNSLETLRADLPSAVIDGFNPPGVGGTSWNGFNGGNTPQKWFETDPGRLILEHHAVTSGYIPDTAYRRPLDGVIRHGLGHMTADSQDAATLNNRLDIAIANGEGMQVMLHPSQINLSGNITTAEFSAHLDYVQQKVTEGVLVVLSPYELVMANKYR